jgi:hypothetical protein
MTTTTWFASRNGHNGPQVTTFDTDISDERHQEAIAKMRDGLECGYRAAKEWND